MRTALKLSLAVAAVAVLVLVVVFGRPAVDSKAAAQSVDAPAAADSVALMARQPGPAANGPQQAQQFNEAAFISDLRNKFAPHIHIQHAQIRSIEQLLSYLKAQYPDDWEIRVQDFLAELFPDLAADLYARYQSLSQYSQWLEQNRADLQRMAVADRQAVLWEARYAAFGADADQIWAAEVRNHQLQQALSELPADLPPVAKAERFLESVNAVYGEQAADFVASRQTELTNRLLATPAVQADLRSLAVPERRQVLRDLRQAMGMDEEALSRWGELDQHRDQLWEAGQSYQRERAQLLASVSADDLPHQLDALRQSYFADAAAQIRIEEESGFFRFAGERRYGRE